MVSVVIFLLPFPSLSLFLETDFLFYVGEVVDNSISCPIRLHENITAQTNMCVAKKMLMKNGAF